MSPVTPEFALSYRAAWAAHDSDAIVAIHTDDTVFAMHRLAEPPVGRHAVREAIAATIRGGLRCRSLHAVAANFPYSSPVTVGYVELRPDLLFAVDPAFFYVCLSFRDRLADPRLRQPEQALLNRLPFVDPDQYGCRRPVLGDRDLLAGARCRVDQLVELVLDLGDRQGLHVLKYRPEWKPGQG